MDVHGKRALVIGLARSGLAVARALARRGAIVTVLDRKPPSEFRDVLPELIKEKIGLELGSQRVETFLRHDLIVTSPGVPWDLPELQAARERMIPVYPEVEAASWFLEGMIAGVTGSNGKTTTTSLLGDMLKASGFPTFVGGNIGNALSAAVDNTPPGTKFVTELSSFQLEGIHEFRPHVAVMLNLSPNHLDRHPSLEAYAQAKRQIFRNQTEQDYAVLNADDEWVAGLQSEVRSRPVFFSRRRELPTGVFASGGKVYYRVRHLERVLFETRDVTLRGDFNLEDVLAATTAACLLGADFAAIRKAVRDFQAVEHRLEFVREIQGVDFYNNSKATSVDATLKSLEAFDYGVHLILGGKDKGAPYAPLVPLIQERVREVLVIGAAAPVITEQLAGSTELVQAGDLATAVYEAFTRSRPGDTVLLAPACSSFDQFKDYEQRGRAFKELVKRLEKDVEAGAVSRRDTGHATRDTGDGTRDTGVGTRDSGFETRDSGHGTRETGVGTRDSGFGVRDSGDETRDTGHEIRDLESGIRDSISVPPVNSEPTTSIPELPIASANSLSPTLDPEAAGPEPVSRVPYTVSPVPSPEPEVPNPEPLTPNPESRVPYTVSPVPSPEPEVPSPEPLTPNPESRVPSPVSAAPPLVVIPSPLDHETTESVSKTVTLSPSAPLRVTFADEGDSPQEEVNEANSADSLPETPVQNDGTPAISAGAPAAEASADKTTEPEVAEAAHDEKNTVHPARHHVELTYVYEVDAVEMPGAESQALPEDEPVISISPETVEVLDDEVLPFEVRAAGGDAGPGSGVRGPASGSPGPQSGDTGPESGDTGPESGVRSPESGGRGSGSRSRRQKSDARPAKSGPRGLSRQPKLFNGREG